MSGSLSPTAPTSRRLAGVVEGTIDGIAYNVVSYTWSPSSFTRATLASMTGIDGYSETPSPSFIEMTIRDARNVAVAAFTNMTNATVILNLANSKQIVGHNMWCTTAQEVSGAEATFTVRFEGADVYEGGVAE